MGPILVDLVSTPPPSLSLSHLLGYTHAEKAVATAQRRTVMLCLRRLAKVEREEEPADKRRRVSFVRGEALNPGKAVKAYEGVGGGEDVWTVILKFAF